MIDAETLERIALKDGFEFGRLLAFIAIEIDSDETKATEFLDQVATGIQHEEGELETARFLRRLADDTEMLD